MLVLHCMNLALEEIATHCSRIRQEIMEREIVLAAFDVVEKYAANGHAPKSMRLDSFVSVLLPSKPTLELKEASIPATAAPPALPPAPRPEPYIHPELKAIGIRHGSKSQAVSWAIEQMSDDYSLRDLYALLTREGFDITPGQVSVVLTRLKDRHEIEEVKHGYGPAPAVFRKPEAAETNPLDPTDDAENAILSVATT